MSAEARDLAAPAEPAPGSAARDWAFSVALLVVALLPRLFVAIAWAREPVWDGHYYHFGATRIAEGLGYSEDVLIGGATVWKPWCHYPVGYSALLAASYVVFGPGLLVAPVVNAFIGAALAVVTHRLARHHLSEGRARAAGALVALHPGLIAYSAVLMTEIVAGLLVTAAGWVAIRARARWSALAGAAVLVGLATLVRPSALAAAPLLWVLQPGRIGRRLAGAAVATVIALAVVSPWTARNCRVMDGCALVSTNGGWNLAIGALTETGRFRTLRATDGCPVVTGQVQQDRCWAEVGANIIADDPARWLALVPKKLSQTYDHESFAIEYLAEANPEAWPEQRRRAGRGLLTVAHQLLIAIACLGGLAWPAGAGSVRPQARAIQGALVGAVLGFALYASVGHEHPFWVLAAALPVALVPLPGAPSMGPVARYLLLLVLVTTMTHAVFFGDDRYHLVVTPALCILAAGALRPPKGT